MRTDSVPLGKMIDKETGDITPEWRSFHDQMVRQLQTFINQERYKLPALTQNSVNALNYTANPNNNVQHIGSILYNSDLLATQVNNGGLFQQVSTIQTVADMTALAAIPTNQIDGRFVQVTSPSNNVYLGVNGVWKQVGLT